MTDPPTTPTTQEIATVSEKFPLFAAAVKARYDDMAKRELFVVDIEDIFATYLASFPQGTDPIFRERTEHDCNCCKSFIRKLGCLVAIDDAGEIMTVWDVEAPDFYQAVADTLAEVVKQAPIYKVFRTKENQFGTAHNYDTKTERRWDHFHGAVVRRHHSASPGEEVGSLAAAAHVFLRGLDELQGEALATIQDLIDQGSLYRGDEHKASLAAFRQLHTAYQTTPNRDLFGWANLQNPAARFRNTVMGTLAVDLSNGVDLERAVRSFEQKVAPTNYKRPTALITQRMVDDAVKTLGELGLETAIERRFARIADVSVNNVLFVDRSVAGKMKDGVAGLLADAVKPKAVALKDPEKIQVQDFFDRIVPKAQSIEVLLQNRHLGNFASLTAPAHADAARLFKWDNGFAWSYDGDVADSIKERVKRAGGKVTGTALRVSLAWFNFDDLDLHCRSPNGEIYYGNKMGILDVDMNAGSGHTREAVENLSWTTLADGSYQVFVNQYNKRETKDLGFTIEIEHDAQVSQFSYAPAVSGKVAVANITVRGRKVVEIVMAPHMKGGATPTDKWGMTTEALVPVDTILLSPNHWDGQGVGLRHWFFMLRGCRNPGETRGLYNEFLRPEMEKHRKVFEVLGSKAKCPSSADQLSGVGFSSARGDTATVIAKGPGMSSAFELQF